MKKMSIQKTSEELHNMRKFDIQRKNGLTQGEIIRKANIIHKDNR